MSIKTICNLLENEQLFPQPETFGYSYPPAECVKYDVLLCGLDHVDYAEVLADHKESFLIVALDEPDAERFLVPNTFHAWIDKKRPECLPEMLDAYANIIEEKRSYRKISEMMEKFVVDSSVHNANLDGIKLSMRESTQEIEKIFEERVKEMRSIHNDTAVAHKKLTELKERIVPEEFKELEESWNTTQSILSRTDEVIVAMFEFVTILQCEDRITQMIDGIGKILNKDIEDAKERGCAVSLSKEKRLKERLVEFYTIQEQRDYAMGQDDAMKERTCKRDTVAIEEFTLF